MFAIALIGPAIGGVAFAGDVSWKVAASGDFNTAENWEGGAVPGAGENAIIGKTGADYTVTLGASPSMSSNLLVIGASSGGATTTKVEIVGSDKNITFDETFFKIYPNGVLRIADGAHVQLNALTSDGGTAPKRYIFNGDNGGRNGRLELDNATMDIDLTKSYGLGYNYKGTIVLTNGAVMTLHDRNTTAVGPHISGWEGGEMYIGDTSKLVFENPLKGSGNFTFGDLVLSGDAEICAPFKCFAFTSRNVWYVGDTKRYRTSHVVIRDNAKLNNLDPSSKTSNRTFTINDSCDAGTAAYPETSGIVFDYCTSWRGLYTYGFYIGQSAYNAVMNMYGGSYIYNHGNGLNIGTPNGNGIGRGTMNVREGAVFCNGSAGQYENWHYALYVGSSEFTSLANASARGYGTLNVQDGAITNKPYETKTGVGCYFLVGASHGEGEVNQTGGVIAHRSRYQTVIGLRGGTGRYNVSGGLSDIESDVYVGGIALERMCSTVEGVNHLGSATFRANSDYLNKAATGTVYVTGGTFQTVSNLYVSTCGKGTIRLGGDSTGLLAAKDIVLSSTTDGEKTYASDVAFAVGRNGTSLLKANGKLAIGDGATLTVTVTENPEETWIKLIEYGEVEGDFARVKLLGSGEIVRRTRLGVNAYWLHRPRGLVVSIR